MRHNYLFLLLVIVLNTLPLFAQNLNFYHYGLEDGLSQITVRCLLKDSNGFLWLGTQDGLNRFDGTSFKVYKNDKNDNLSISGNFINAMIEDNNGNIWIGTNDNGISIYDSSTNTFKTSKIDKGFCSSLSKTNDGNIVATVPNVGIILFKADEQSAFPNIISEINGESLQFNSSFIENSTLYVSTQSGRLFLSHDILSANPNFQEIQFENKSFGTINTLFFQNHGIWLGTSNGLYRYDTITNTLVNILLEPLLENNKNLFVSSIDVRNDTFYIGTFGGLFIANDFNTETQKFKDIITFKGEQDHNNSITSNRVYDTYTDGELLWVGTNNLDVVTLKQPVFQNVNTLSNIKLNNSFILSFAKNKDYVFVGTRKGINCINRNNEVTYITQENTNQTLAFNVIRAMAIDHNNYLWVATIKGISVIDLNNFDPNSPKVLSTFHDTDNSKSLSSDATRGIYIDHKGSVWIMTYGGGINRFTGNLKTNTFTFEHYKAYSNLNSISSDFTYNMSQDKDLNYWITSEDGLNKLQFEDENYSNSKFTIYYTNKNDSTSISSNTTLHTWHDKNQTLWVATQDGFNKFNAENQTFKRYGKADGLSNTFVYSITEDLDNDLWLTTNGGLFRFNKTTKQFTNYDQGDGVQSSEFNLGAHLYDSENNTIYVGGVNGFNIFNPRMVSELDKVGDLTFTTIRIKDKEINPLTNPDILKETITTTNDIVLNHTDFPCYINFSDLDLRPNKNNQFAYSLNDNQWNELRDSREIPLLSLPKGSHVLQIQGKSRDMVWDKEPLKLNIKVIPPWYQSNLAYLFYLLAFLGVVYAFYTIRLQRQIAGQESKRLQELDNLKTRFITNITHEFRTPLTIILGYLGNLKERFSNKDDVNSSLHTIEQNSNNLLNLVNQMLDLAKLEKGQLNLNLIQSDIVVFSSHILNSFLSIASEKRIILNFSSNQDKILMDFDAEKMRQILTNLISNAIKFSPEDSALFVKVNKVKNRLKLKVTDTGYGIPEDELSFVFHRFYQVENNEHKISQGTGIGLALTKELVELFNGTITVTSKLGNGTTFTITLPITNTSQKENLNLNDEQLTLKTFVPQLNEAIADDDSNTVLIVEDNADMAKFIASCLQPEYRVSFAINGEEGLELAKRDIPDIIITDVMMPVMDGFEFTQKLQADTNTNHIPIIMLTSKAMQEDKLKGITSGADAYLTKPFQKEELRLRMQMLVAKRKQLQERYAVTTIVEQKEEQTKPTDKNLIFLNSVIDAIHQHIDDSNFGATELANFMAMSDSQLYRKLKAISNTSTAIFIRKVRLEKAKELLNSTDLSISEIAYSTGFNDPNWFSKAFKEEFKDSPSIFRN